MKIAQFKALLKKGISLDEIYILELIKENIAVQSFLTSNREKALYNKMLRRLLINEDGGITKIGEEALSILSDDYEEIVIPEHEDMKQNGVGFDEWWEIFPASNHFEYKGRTFKGTRKLNLSKSKCKEIFERYVKLNIFTAEDIINATESHINEIKEQSWRKGENQLTYCPNSQRYLEEKRFDPFINISKKAEVKEFEI